MAALSALRASVGIAVSCGGEMGSDVVGTMAELVTAGADVMMGGMVVVVVVGTAVAEEALEPDMADTRLLEFGLLRRGYE
jgi:hypothetical protein